MRNMLKHTAKMVLKKLGYALKPSQNCIPDVLLSPLDHERDSLEYDHVWTHNGLVEHYLDKRRLEFYHALCDHIRSKTPIQTVASVVDVGCGPGYLLKLIAEVSPEAKLVGLDLSPEVLKVARATCPSATFRKHNVYEELLETFGLAICTEVLEHLDYPHRALDQLARSSPNVVLTVPNGRKDNYLGHINFWSMRSWEVFLERYSVDWEYEADFLCQEEKIVTIMRRRS